MKFIDALILHLKVFWMHYVLGAGVLWTVFNAFLNGFFTKLGEWWASHRKQKEDHKIIREKVARADERGRLYDLVTEQYVSLKKQLNSQGLELSIVRNKLEDCDKVKSDLSVKNAKLIAEARTAAIENGKLLGENATLMGRLDELVVKVKDLEKKMKFKTA
jgi:hypothetical protein